MFTPDNISALLNGLSSCAPNKNANDIKTEPGDNSTSLGPDQILVIAGLLANVLEVESILFNKNQTIEIVLTGSLKRKTELDTMLDNIGSMSFDEVISAILSRAT